VLILVVITVVIFVPVGTVAPDLFKLFAAFVRLSAVLAVALDRIA
jgi:hypothetical protein